MAPSPLCLVTGAAGFVGRAILEHLHDRGIPVRGTYKTGSRELDPKLFESLDVLNESAIRHSLRDVGTIVHAAGMAHQFGRNSTRKELFHAVNTVGTENIVRQAIQQKVGHVVLISSVSVYGSRGQKEFNESDECQPRGEYAKSKLMAERAAMELVANSDVQLTILRLSTVYGEGDPGNVARLMRAIDRGRFVWIGSGMNRKSLIHRDDVARACAAVLRSDSATKQVRIFNVSAPAVSMADVVHTLADALRRRPAAIRLPAAATRAATKTLKRLLPFSEAPRRVSEAIDKWLQDDVFDATAFNEQYQFRTTVSLTEGLQREVDWYRGHACCGRPLISPIVPQA